MADEEDVNLSSDEEFQGSASKVRFLLILSQRLEAFLDLISHAVSG